jgi:hypothetical protein
MPRYMMNDHHDGYSICMTTLVQERVVEYGVMCQRNASVFLSMLITACHSCNSW